MHTITPSRTSNPTIAWGTNLIKTVKHTLWILQTVCGCHRSYMAVLWTQTIDQTTDYAVPSDINGEKLAQRRAWA